jgi:hypothetical protein
LLRSRTECLRDATVDVRDFLGSHGVQAPADAREWALIGGGTGFASGCLIRANVGSDIAETVRRRLVLAAFTAARDEGLFPVSLYVRNCEIDAFRTESTGPPLLISQSADLHITADSYEAHIAAEKRPARQTLRRDRRDAQAMGLELREVPPAEVIGLASPMICSNKQKHGILDHPRLAAYRLQQWLAATEGPCVAFLAAIGDGAPIAITFASVDRSAKLLEVYELGLSGEESSRHAAYVQAMIHGPIKYAIRAQLRRIELGLEAAVPKRARGAHLAPVWVVAG